jgi:Tol biopolymer transport system component
VVYRARREDGLPVLWVRDLATGESRALPGTEDAYYPFWSPDSRHLGFAAGYALKRVPSAGGQVQVITRTSGLGVSASWAADGTVVYGPSDTSPLHRVPAEGGTPTVITTLQGNDWSHRYPWLLPDGRRFLFTAVQYTMAAEASASGVYLGSLDGAVPTRILGDLSNAVYASPGYILFSRAGVLTAAPFDLPSGRVVGEAFTLGEPVAFDGATNLAGLSAAADGTVAVRPPPALLTLGAAVATELRVVDRRGATLAASAPALYSHRMAMHPGGRTIAVQMTDERTGTNDLHQVNLLTGERAPLTSTNAWAGRPVWSADGSQLAYANQPVGLADDLYIKDLRTGSDEPIIQSKMNFEQPAAWSHDGRHLVFYRIRNDGASLHTFTLSSKTETPFAVMRPGIQVAFSPDDRYLAVTSFDSGQVETIVKSFPDGRQSWPLTSSGGWPISWHTNGREILVATLSGEIVAYSVSTAGGQFSAGQPEVLVRNVGMSAQHAVATADHSRIVIRVDPQAARDKGEIRLLFGWTRP